MRIKCYNAHEASEPKAATGELRTHRCSAVMRHVGINAHEWVSGSGSDKMLTTAYLWVSGD